MNILIFSMLSVFVSILSIFLIIKIFSKVYNDEYKRPWLFIAFCSLFLGASEMIDFLSNSFQIYIFSKDSSKLASDFLIFISNSFLAYGILLEFLIINYMKGKYVKLKFVPLSEGSASGGLDLNVSFSKSYICFNERKKEVLEEICYGFKNGYQGFLLLEQNPIEVKGKYNLERTPICYIYEIKNRQIYDEYKKEFNKKANIDICDPHELTNFLNYISTFLEQADKPIIAFQLDSILKKNEYSIVNDFVNYIKKKVEKYNGICIFLVNEKEIEFKEIDELKFLLNEIDF
jgi:hypothetical protein